MQRRSRLEIESVCVWVRVPIKTGVRGNEAADKLANRGAEISEGHRFVERGSAEPTREYEEHKDNG